MSKTFTYAERSMLKKDWQSLLPNMAFKPKTSIIAFRRIVGPLVISLGLNLNGGLGWKYYSLEYFVHNLSYPEDCMIMQIHNIPRKILVDFDNHKDEFFNAAEAIKQDAWIPIDGTITLDDIFNGYSNSAKAYYRRRNENYEESLISLTKAFNGDLEKAKERLDLGGLTHKEAATPALVAAWAGDTEKAKKYWEWGSKVCDSNKMIEQYGHLIDQPELLRETARSEHLKYGLAYAPYQDIADAPYKENNKDLNKV